MLRSVYLVLLCIIDVCVAAFFTLGYLFAGIYKGFLTKCSSSVKVVLCQIQTEVIDSSGVFLFPEYILFIHWNINAVPCFW